MKAGMLLLIAHDIIETLVGLGLLSPEGDLVAPTVEQDAQLAQKVESILKNHGVAVQENVDKVIQILPLVLQMAGVK